MWIVPSSIDDHGLQERHRLISHYMENPIKPKGKSALTLIKKKKEKKEKIKKVRKEGINPRIKNDEFGNSNFLSAEFIEDSDDFDDDDFFKKEQERRKNLSLLYTGAVTDVKKPDKLAPDLKKRTKKVESEDEETEEIQVEKLPENLKEEFEKELESDSSENYSGDNDSDDSLNELFKKMKEHLNT